MLEISWKRVVPWLTDRPPRGLNASERRLWEAYPVGETAALDSDAPSVRAEVITALLLGARDPRPGHVPAVRLHGARVTGRLDVSGGTVDCELGLEDCTLDERPDFDNARTRRLRFDGCRMPGFDGGGLRAEGYLSFSGSVIDGEVRLVRADLSDGFRMNHTRITASNGIAVNAGALVDDDGTFWRHAEITGTVRLTGARFNGGFFLYGATLRTAGGTALEADNISVENTMECSRGFTAEGGVRLRGATVNGTLSFDQGALRAEDGRALHLSHARIDELVLTPREPIVGEVSLGYSRITTILDRVDTWPEALRLNGLTYDSLRGGPESMRLNWVSRDPEGFRPQPYEQLAGWLRRIGRDDLARRTQLAKQRARRRNIGVFSRVWGVLLDWTVGYGYRPWLAALWLALLLIAGTVTFALDHPHSIRQPQERPHFNPFIYALDLMLPISAFGQRSAWDPLDWSQWLAYGLTGAGWILATALIAGATRILRRR